jgi:hypothetical protein
MFCSPNSNQIEWKILDINSGEATGIAKQIYQLIQLYLQLSIS